MGIEPTYEAWEAAVLPLNYTRSGRDSTCIPRPASHDGLLQPRRLPRLGDEHRRRLRTMDVTHAAYGGGEIVVA
jgi:hypothetical protein